MTYPKRQSLETESEFVVTLVWWERPLNGLEDSLEGDGNHLKLDGSDNCMVL